MTRREEGRKEIDNFKEGGRESCKKGGKGESKEEEKKEREQGGRKE